MHRPRRTERQINRFRLYKLGSLSLCKRFANFITEEPSQTLWQKPTGVVLARPKVSNKGSRSVSKAFSRYYLRLGAPSKYLSVIQSWPLVDKRGSYVRLSSVLDESYFDTSTKFQRDITCAGISLGMAAARADSACPGKGPARPLSWADAVSQNV